MSDTKPDLDAIEADLNDPWLPDRATVDELVAYARTLEAEVERLGALEVQWTDYLDMKDRAEAAEAERDRLAQRLDQVRALVNESGDGFMTFGGGYSGGMVAADDLRRVLDGDQRTEQP